MKYTRTHQKLFSLPEAEMYVWLFSVGQRKAGSISMREHSNASVAEGHKRLLWVAWNNEAAPVYI